MQVARRFSVVRHSDHALPAPAAPRPLLTSSVLDVRAWRGSTSTSALPALLVHAPRRTGNAVERNRFKRRTRMALLNILKEIPALALGSWIFWVRPAKGSPLGCKVDYAAIEGQLRLALLRLG